MSVVSAVAAITQQHVVGVAFAPADAAASVEDGAGPEDGALEAGQVHKYLQHTHARAHKRPSCCRFISLERQEVGVASYLGERGAGQ